MHITVLICLSSLFCFSVVKGQDNLSKESSLTFSIGKSVHGSGDIPGFIFSAGYAKQIKKSFLWNANISATLHDGKYPVYFTTPAGNMVDGSYRYTTGGMQGSFLGSYNFLKNNIHKLEIRLGAVLRYQSSSYYDVVSVYYPAATGLPIPVLVIENTTPQRTVAIGAIGEVYYGYKITPKLILGVIGGFQVDTNGDTIRYTGLSISRVLIMK
jgi:hypothetical protein